MHVGATARPARRQHVIALRARERGGVESDSSVARDIGGMSRCRGVAAPSWSPNSPGRAAALQQVQAKVLGEHDATQPTAVFKSPRVSARACGARAMEPNSETEFVSSFSPGHQLRDISLQLIAVMGFNDWRRGWDSNPRAPYRTRRFRGAPVTTTSVPLRMRCCST
jgi:hypothetical protein